MCKCTPNIRTPFCGKPGCEAPPQKTATIASFEQFEKERGERVMQLRLEDFHQRWMPKDHYEASRFSADLHMLVRSIYAEAAEPANKQMLALMKCMPIVNPWIQKDKP